jgi:hypothetical protein
MNDRAENGQDEDSMDLAGVLGQVQRLLAATELDDGWHATEEDFIIVQCLLTALHAARRKGYSEELLIRVFRGLIESAPGA